MNHNFTQEAKWPHEEDEYDVFNRIYITHSYSGMDEEETPLLAELSEQLALDTF